MADRIEEFNDYDLVWAIEALSSAVDGFSDPNMYAHNNHYITDLGINFDKEYSMLYDKLYSLCEIVVQKNIVDPVRSELESDKADTYYFDDIVEELDYFAKEKIHEDLMYSVEVGDKVRLHNGNVRYVHSIDGDWIWVTARPNEERGWSAQLHEVVEILEKNNED